MSISKLYTLALDFLGLGPWQTQPDACWAQVETILPSGVPVRDATEEVVKQKVAEFTFSHADEVPFFPTPPPAPPGDVEPVRNPHRILLNTKALGPGSYTAASALLEEWVASNDGRPHVVGIRMLGPNGARTVTDRFDDLVCTMLPNPILEGGWIVTMFHATVDPGRKYTVSPLNPAGVAIWAPGFIENSHKFGLHRGRYTALVQNKPVKFFRDNTHDDELALIGAVESGWIGLNVHAAANDPNRALDRQVTRIGPWSAGCWVLSNSEDYLRFISILKGSGQEEFSTLLIEAALDV